MPCKTSRLLLHFCFLAWLLCRKVTQPDVVTSTQPLRWAAKCMCLVAAAMRGVKPLPTARFTATPCTHLTSTPIHGKCCRLPLELSLLAEGVIPLVRLFPCMFFKTDDYIVLFLQIVHSYGCQWSLFWQVSLWSRYYSDCSFNSWRVTADSAGYWHILKVQVDSDERLWRNQCET